MALLKAFMCQVVLFGLYKLFLEEIVEQHLVPDELTRNSLVGVVCLLCFGIQLYTDVAEDDSAETEEEPKEKFKARESTGAKKFESAEISVSHEIVTETAGWSASNHVMITRTQTTSQEIATEKSQQVVYSKEGNSPIPSSEAEKVTKVSHSGFFVEFSTSASDKIGVCPSTVKTDEQDTKTIPVVNGLPEVNVSEESDEKGIEIDQLVSKKSSEEAEQLMTVEAEEVDRIKPEHVTEAVNVCGEAEKLIAVEAEEIETIKPEHVTEAVYVSGEAEQLTTVEAEETETTKPEHTTEAAAESECLASNGMNISSEQVLDSDPMIAESNSRVTNGTVMESFNNIDEIPSNIIGEIESKNSVKDGNEIGNGQEMPSTDAPEPDVRKKDYAESLPSAQEMDYPSTVSSKTETLSKNSIKDGNEIGNGRDAISRDASEPDVCTKDLTESLPSAQEVDSPSTVSTKTVNEVLTVNKNSAETSTVLNATLLSPRRKITTEDVCVTPVSIDISFIYACH